jgi:hypothetical protein
VFALDLSRPAAMACNRTNTVTTSATPRIVAAVERHRTKTLLKLYGNGIGEVATA